MERIAEELRRFIGVRQLKLGYLRKLRSELRLTPEAARPFARAARQRRGDGRFFSGRGQVRAGPPCWREGCDARERCAGSQKCSVYRAATKEFLRRVLAEGPFRPRSKYSYLNEVAWEHGTDASEASVPVLRDPPKRSRRRCGACPYGRRRGWPTLGCAGGRQRERSHKSTVQERVSRSLRRIAPAPRPSTSSMDSRRRFLIGRRTSTGSLKRRPPISFDRTIRRLTRKKARAQRRCRQPG